MDVRLRPLISLLFHNYPIITIPNCLDPNIFRPLNQKVFLRKKYGVPIEKFVILCGAFDFSEHRKGWDLLEGSIKKITNKDRYILLVFGTNSNLKLNTNSSMQTKTLGYFSNELELSEIYNLSDVTCVPSRQESFGQTVLESMACGVPVVAFNTTGIVDIIDHKINGYLAEPYYTEDFARGIEWVISKKSNNSATNKNKKVILDKDKNEYLDNELCINSRNKAMRFFSNKTVATKFINVYKEVLKNYQY